MKQSPARFVRSRSSKLSSFTLVELLVVMGIIAILAAVIQSAGLSALRMALRTKASTMANQIQTSCLSYYTEYSVYPICSDAAAGTDVNYGTADLTHWSNLVVALCGNVNAYNGTTVPYTTVTNSRGIAFLSLKRSDVDANGVPVNPINPYTAPANQYFNMAMNGSYNGLMGVANGATYITNFSLPTMPQSTITLGVAVWANCNTGTYTNNNYYVRTY